MPKVSHQHVSWVWHCIGAPTCQGQWTPECSATRVRWRTQLSSTPKGYIRGSEMVRRGNLNQKHSLGNHFWWEVLDCSWSLQPRHWSQASSAGITGCSYRFSICVPIAKWSISENRFTNPRSCNCTFCFLLLNWMYDDTKPPKIYG